MSNSTEIRRYAVRSLMARDGGDFISMNEYGDELFLTRRPIRKWSFESPQQAEAFIARVIDRAGASAGSREFSDMPGGYEVVELFDDAGELVEA